MSQIFFSYSHRDKKARDQVLPFLSFLEREGQIDVWSDLELKPGDLWPQEIQTSLASATVAVLLISQNFLASKFIVNQELPLLLEKAGAGRLTLIPIFLAPSNVREIDLPFPNPQGKIRLSDFEGIGSPDKTLKEMDKADRERALTELAVRIRRLTEPANVQEEPPGSTYTRDLPSGVPGRREPGRQGLRSLKTHSSDGCRGIRRLEPIFFTARSWTRSSCRTTS